MATQVLEQRWLREFLAHECHETADGGEWLRAQSWAFGQFPGAVRAFPAACGPRLAKCLACPADGGCPWLSLPNVLDRCLLVEDVPFPAVGACKVLARSYAVHASMVPHRRWAVGWVADRGASLVCGASAAEAALVGEIRHERSQTRERIEALQLLCKDALSLVFAYSAHALWP